MSSDTPQELCIFCQIQNAPDSAAIVYEDAICMILLDLYPLVNYHCLVIPKVHVQHLSGLSEAQRSAWVERINACVSVLKSELSEVQAVNLVLNDGRAAGQHIAHVHMHVLPRTGRWHDTYVLRWLIRGFKLAYFLLAKKRHSAHLKRQAERLAPRLRAQLERAP